MFPGLVNSDALDYAQIARNLSKGRGFTTYFLRPLALTHGDNVFRQPDLTHGPLFPVVLAVAFVARGATDAIVAYISGVFYLLTVPVVYWLGRRIFSSVVGFIGALIFMANPLILQYSVSGLPITLQIFVVTCLLLVVYSLASKSQGENSSPLPRGELVLCAGLVGGLYLIDPVFLYVVPVITIAVMSLTRGRWGKSLPLYGVTLLIVIVPWMIRNGQLTGNPFFGLRSMEVWMGTKDYYPGALAYRTMPQDLIPGVGLYKAVVRKIFLGAGEVVQGFPQVSASWMLAFLLPSLLFRFRDGATNVVRRVMMYCFLGILVGMLPFGVELPLFAPLIPTMLLFAIAYLLQLIEQSRVPRSTITLVTVLLTGAVILPLLRDVFLLDKPKLAGAVNFSRFLQQNADKEDVVLTDQPWLVSWYADRPAIWAPAVDGNIKLFRKRFSGLRWLLVTDEVRSFSPEWSQVYTVFFQWNTIYGQAKNAGRPLPAPLVVQGAPFILVDALNGFTVLAPVAGSPPEVILAVLPKGATGSN
ncbi:ArnT family glycosyltransferase [Armatimonas rosea]|uniref:4-amino-4-deoxy-L-arabinose transferase-like glycosyltransferase n=1 Tax=Armatimonas rosea TaxID=685828 RepID=A0A7W9SVB5_ARMRO|nr:glycosyltransferase family 39 protein [Armatimonas rosea]MBB6053005.1 4-amino-4-deoxy-L-arabinose transferase-like glycosyltransferase [Armatimonas rosea]